MTRGGWIVLGAAAAAGLGAAVWLARPQEPQSEEQRILALFDGAARAAEERNTDEVIEILSERFVGDGGELAGKGSRDEVKRLIAFELLRGKWVSVQIIDAKVVVRESLARAAVDAVLSRAPDPGKRLSDLLPGEYSLNRFDLELEREGDEWRVVSGTWRHIGLEQALSGPELPDW